MTFKYIKQIFKINYKKPYKYKLESQWLEG